MRRRHRVASSILLLLLYVPTTATASNSVIAIDESRQITNDLDLPVRLDPHWVGDYRYDRRTDDFIDAVTLRELPPGSIRFRFDGFHSFALKHARSQYRRFVRQAVDKGWYVVGEDMTSEREIFEQVDHQTWRPLSNGVWWQRSWLESLPPEKGGAPAVPYIHTYGEEVAWKFGPLTVTNTLKFKFDYVAFFELNPDPVDHDHPKKGMPVSLDLQPTQDTTIGTYFRFRVKPRIRLGLPKDGDWLSVLRNASIRGSFEIRHRGQRVIQGEAEIKWRKNGGLTFVLELALVSW